MYYYKPGLSNTHCHTLIRSSLQPSAKQCLLRRYLFEESSLQIGQLMLSLMLLRSVIKTVVHISKTFCRNNFANFCNLTFIEYFLSLVSALFLSRLAWYQEHPLGDPYWAPGLGGRGGSTTGADSTTGGGSGKRA